MRARNLMISVALTVLICVFSSAAPGTAGRKTGDLNHQMHSLDSSKSVPGQLNYQGFLATADSGAVNETLGMTFRLFDSETGGTLLWSETHPAVEVSNGRFYVLLGSVTPFPEDVFDGSILYLQMEVGTEVFSPRKAIVSVAYSQRAEDATTADSAAHAAMADEADHAARADSAAYAIEAGHASHADTAAYSPGTNPWSVSGDNVYRLTGRVGVGTASPSTELEVIGTVDADAYTVNGVPIGTSTDTYWNRTGDDIYYTIGNVGVGTASPTARLQVEGGKGHDGSLCSSDYAVYGKHSSGNEGTLGDNTHGAYGKNNNGNEGYLGGNTYGAGGKEAASGNYGHLGTPDKGAEGVNNNGNWGGLGLDEYGVYGATFSALGGGVYGHNNASGNYGMLGDSTHGAYGKNNNGNVGYLGGNTYGSGGKNATSGNYGMLGTPDRGTEGVNSNGNYGYFGGDNYGAYGEHNAGNGGFIGSSDYGVYGQHNSGNYGVLGETGVGVHGQNVNGHWGSLGGTSTGAYGRHNNNNYGVLGHSNYGAFGLNNTSGNYGWLGGNTLDYGAYGHHYNSGNYGILGSEYYGAYGHNDGTGNYGFLGGDASSDCGAYGKHANSGNYGYLGGSNYAVYGKHNNGNEGCLGSNEYAVYGKNSSSGNWGFIGNAAGGVGVQGVSGSSGNWGTLGSPNWAVYGHNVSSGTWAQLASNTLAGYFGGSVSISSNLSVSGTITKGDCQFKIDHPLDPENKYLYHSCVESADMKNIYDGVVTLDVHGESWVELPEWFGALNRDFRYQLTPIGAPGPNLYIAEEISGNHFKIAGGNPGMKVSWLVTGIRQDPYANLHRILVEEDKPPEEQGYYLHPKAYGQSEERNVQRVHYPEIIEENLERAEAQVAQPRAPVRSKALSPGIELQTSMQPGDGRPMVSSKKSVKYNSSRSE